MPATYSTHVRGGNFMQNLDGEPEGKRPTPIVRDGIKRDLKEIALDMQSA
jgi:hypothetical protein